MATYEAATKARDQILKMAAERLDCAVESLVLDAGHVRRPRRMSYAEIIAGSGAIRTQGFYKSADKGSVASMCVQVAEVEVKPQTGEVKLKSLPRYTAPGK